jgi:outer membrane protein assembly factor BamA
MVVCKCAIAVGLAISMSGCTATKFLGGGEAFYEGAEIKLIPQGHIGGRKRLKDDLKTYVKPKANAKFLGSRPGVWFYYIAGTPSKNNGLRSFVKNKLGSPPVLISDVDPNEVAEALENQVNNEGYFGSTVSHETLLKKKAGEIIYTITLEPPFRLDTIDYRPADSAHMEPFRSFDSKSFDKVRLLKTGQRFSVSNMRLELHRLEDVAKNNGYYFFDDRYLVFEADTTAGNRKVNLALSIEGSVPDQVSRRYRMNEISVFPNFVLTNDSLATTADTLIVDRYQYIDNQHLFRPEVITSVINLKPDSVYRKIDHEYTVSRVMGLKVFKFVNVKLSESSTDSSLLNAKIYLTPLQKKSLRVQLQGISKSNNFVGPGLELAYTNRNLFRGAELLQLKLDGSYEWQISRQQGGAINAIEIGGSASLAVPRFISPIPIRYHSFKYLPQTEIRAGFNGQRRLQYYGLASFSVGYGYTWRETTLKTHELFPVDVTFVRVSHTSEEFEDRLENDPNLANSFQNQFITGLRYSYTYNSQLREDIEEKFNLKKSTKTNVYLNASLELAGNALYGIQSIGARSEEPYEIFGAPYSQFALGALDFRYYIQLDEHQRLATRVAVGAGVAYGNAEQLPYIKQFAVGGSTSLRAFPARSVGPGTYNVRTDPAYDSIPFAYFIDQRGDIKLEGNLEYRFDLIKRLKGALFADAGNIWLWNEDPSRPGGRFDTETFLGELAVGMGVGLRYDFNVFIFRFDLAFPIRKPYLEPGQRWVIDQIDFGSSAWRRENLVLNIAIGYPF